MRWLLGLALLAASAAAQGDRFITFTLASGTNVQSRVVEIDHTATVLRTLGTLGNGLFPRQVVMDDDNRGYRLVGNAPLGGYAGFVFDVTPGGKFTTAVSGYPLIDPRALLRTDGPRSPSTGRASAVPFPEPGSGPWPWCWTPQRAPGSHTSATRSS